MRKLLSTTILAIAAAAALTACGGSSAPATTAAPASTAAPETTAAAETKAEETKAEETKAEETKAEVTKAEETTDEEVVRAADAAYVDHFIRTLESGYETEINEETTNISQGQKQLLTIARAFLADPKILILDEATSSVDTRTEILIQKGMENLMKGRTSFVIAHRLSTIRNADLILVMDHGDIVEAGKHEELLEKNGFYAKLYNAQFEES